MPSDLVLCARIVSCFVKRVETFVSNEYSKQYFEGHEDFKERLSLSDSDISGEIVMTPGSFGVRCDSWRLRYENGYADDITTVQDFSPRLFYEIELSKPSGYSFSVKHRAALIRLGFKPVSENVLKPWSRITTRIGLHYKPFQPYTGKRYLGILGIVPPQDLYDNITGEYKVQYPRRF